MKKKQTCVDYNIDLKYPIEQQLQECTAICDAITKRQFNDIQRNGSLWRVAMLIYRTQDMELANGTSEVSFYSLCYCTNGFQKSYFLQTITISVPPTHFLKDYETAQIVQWLRARKGQFLRTTLQ